MSAAHAGESAAWNRNPTAVREMYHVLRALHRPVELSRISIATALQTSFATASPADAVRLLAERAFQSGDLGAQQLWEAVRGDFEGRKTSKSLVARSNGMSERAYYRRRRQAVERLLLEAQRVLDTERADLNLGVRVREIVADFDPVRAGIKDDRVRALIGMAPDEAGTGANAALPALRVIAEAQQALVKRQHEILDECERAAVDSSGEPDVPARAIVAEARFVLARYAGDARGTRAAAQEVVALAGRLDQPWRITALLYAAEAAVYDGNLKDAAANLRLAESLLNARPSLRRMLTASLHRAQLAFVGGNLQECEENAELCVDFSFAHTDIRGMGCILLLRCGSGGDRALSELRAGTPYFRLWAQALGARASLKGEQFGDAAPQAERTLDDALHRGYAGLAAHAAATYHAALLRAGNDSEARGLLREAIRLYFKTGLNACTAADLFEVCAGSRESFDVPEPIGELISLYHEECAGTPLAQDQVAALETVVRYAFAHSPTSRMSRAARNALLLQRIPGREALALCRALAVLARRSERELLFEQIAARIASAARAAHGGRVVSD